jgi:hypothetical protein
LPAANDVSRFLTEQAQLTVNDQDTSSWIAEGGAGLSIVAAEGGNGWTVTFSNPGVPLPARGRIRIWRPVEPDDAELFDLEHRDEPTREGIRSYLDEGFWLPIRDFSVEIADLPGLRPVTIAAKDRHELDLPIKVAGPARIVVTPAAGRTLTHERVGDVGPRGERWAFELDGRRAVEAPLVFKVKVQYGSGLGSVDREFDLTVEPNFTIDTNPAGGPYAVSEAAPLTLEIAGGTAPYEVESDPPDGVRANLAANIITMTADDTASAGRHFLIVEDDNDELGLRELRIEL